MPRIVTLTALLLCSSCAPPPQTPGDAHAPLDSPALQFSDRSSADRTRDRALDGVRDRARAEQPAAPDKGVTPDKPPVSPCLTSWSAWACGPTPIPLGCAAQCSDYVLTCIPGLPLAPQACTCQRGGKQKVCTGDGINCDACQDARKSCCQF